MNQLLNEQARLHEDNSIRPTVCCFMELHKGQIIYTYLISNLSETWWMAQVLHHISLIDVQGPKSSMKM